MDPAVDHFPIIYCLSQHFCAEATCTLFFDTVFMFVRTFFYFYSILPTQPILSSAN